MRKEYSFSWCNLLSYIWFVRVVHWANLEGIRHPPEKGMATTLVFLSGESHEQRSLAGCSPWGHTESDDWVTEHACIHERVWIVFPRDVVAQWCLTLRPRGLWPIKPLCPWDSPGKNIGKSSHSLLQGIFLTQGLNLGLLYYRQILYHLSHTVLNP